MTITEQPLVTRWLPCFVQSVQGAVTTREGAYHSPHGTVEVLSQNFRMELAAQMNTQHTRLRMVYAGLGWEYADDSFYEPDRLSRLALAFARLVADVADGRQRQAALDELGISPSLLTSAAA